VQENVRTDYLTRVFDQMQAINAADWDRLLGRQ